MTRPFDDTTRRNIAERCAAFARLPAREPASALKRAAVAITLVAAGEADCGTALLLTRRAAGLRSPPRPMGAARRTLRCGRNTGSGCVARTS
jgi:hypothetical protein